MSIMRVKGLQCLEQWFSNPYRGVENQRRIWVEREDGGTATVAALLLSMVTFLMMEVELTSCRTWRFAAPSNILCGFCKRSLSPIISYFKCSAISAIRAELTPEKRSIPCFHIPWLVVTHRFENCWLKNVGLGPKSIQTVMPLDFAHSQDDLSG